MEVRNYKIGENQSKQIVIEGSGQYVVELVGRGARAEIIGALTASGAEELHVDVTTHHRVPDTSADTFIRAVASDRSKVVLSGMIKIFRGAQKTNAFLTENVLIISDRAKADAVPKLEIEADDVRASHAATVSKINEEQLFYLCSRGLSEQSARELIVEGFLDVARKRIKSKKQ